MRQITYEELRCIQMDILQAVHNFCMDNNIKYSLAYGTLLGAVRHGGYIPWDDDIDIAMLRDDYERFYKEFKDPNGFYKFREARNMENMNIGFGKVEDTRTLLIESANSGNIGINIDVFPIDNMYDSFDLSCKQLKKLNVYKSLLIAKVRPVKVVHGLPKKILMFFLKILLLPVSIHKIVLRFIRSVIKNHNSNSEYVAMILGTSFSMNNIFKRDLWKEYSTISFEGRTFMTVKNIDAYLKLAYGDYMQLPPKEQQVPKHDFEAIYWKDSE